MNDTTQTKAPAEIIVIPRARLAFARIHKAEKSRDDKGNEVGTAKFSCTLLIDPSSVDGKETIAKIKQAALKAVVAKWGPKEGGGWPKANPATGMGGLIMPFGNGNDLPKVYSGFKDMFYLKVADTSRPLLGNRKGEPVVEGDFQCPYAGCYVRSRVSPWTYFPTPKRPRSANGVNFNVRSLQFVEDGEGFGGGGSRTAEEEFEQMAGDAPEQTAEIEF
ncbi:MAG TPA: ssDNA-binding protein [Stellaceae bacterium]|nr:ssDNA-binding protein [Terriglobia bacterium]HEV2551766.1 ssDNA-binding protein [Stellaceae bacterium]